MFYISLLILIYQIFLDSKTLTCILHECTKGLILLYLKSGSDSRIHGKGLVQKHDSFMNQMKKLCFSLKITQI